ncbi:MAG: hypothetical protein JWR59_1591 [Brevundimonas sp.]|nr:hypothetical protein [Brevundimonas sp.]
MVRAVSAGLALAAYCGPSVAPAELWSRWNADPVLLAVLLVLAASLVWGPRRPTRSLPALLAVALLGVAFISPLCALTTSLFAARTVHHLILICVVAPLLVWSGPRIAGRPGVAAVLTATALQTLVLWAWHAPALYGAALSHDAVYWTMQATLLAAAVLFWATIRAANAPTAAFGLVTTMVQMGVLGALLVFAGSAVYAPHALTTEAWGLSSLEDQQLAGLIMWAPAGGLYLVAALVLVGRWLGPDQAPRQAAA